jgi:Dyp-type peroxidase family
MPGPECSDGLGSFQGAFNIGMANRGRVLGDGSSEDWRWTDSDTNRPKEGPRAAHVAVIIYGKKIENCREALADHAKALGKVGRLVHCIDTEPVPTPSKASELQRLEFEHFGFRDGISQPIIRGTQRFAKGALERDIVEPGEFIFGYRNNQDHYPPTPVVRIDSDLADCLPMPPKKPSRFPMFGHGHRPARDFGQNGTYLVIRELAQDVEGFTEFTEKKATELAKGYPKLADVAGGTITAEWVAAKMMGRWRDGTPLVERAGGDKGEGVRKHSDRENDFSYAIDDPQGMHCPFGSHIRRANPRDSLQPDDPAQQSIVNRHRLLRRGRAYQHRSAAGVVEEKGLLFVALCTDLERQFEFVQQTWINSPVFHGLKDEPDPILGCADPETQKFTIPTPSGPLRLHAMQSFVSVKSGGYFFLPSRSAIRYLANLNASKWCDDGPTCTSASSDHHRERASAPCDGIQKLVPQPHAHAMD